MSVSTKPTGRQIAAQDIRPDLGSAAPPPPAPEPQKGRRNRETVPVATRLGKPLRNALAAHFEALGLDLSGGIRMVLSEYAKAKRLT
jgi:hypothetical protein